MQGVIFCVGLVCSTMCFFGHCRSWGVKLKIRPVKLSDEGAYSCIANNSEGTVSMQVFLTVTGMIVFFTRDPMQSQYYYCLSSSWGNDSPVKCP